MDWTNSNLSNYVISFLDASRQTSARLIDVVRCSLGCRKSLSGFESSYYLEVLVILDDSGHYACVSALELSS